MDSEEQAFDALRAELERIGQAHIFEEFDAETDDERAEAFALQLLKLDKTTPGGLVDYCQRGKKLMQASSSSTGTSRLLQAGDCLPPPLGDVLMSNSPQFEECQELGWQEMGKLAFVLVAGGLGERLGFPKTLLETDLLTHKNMLHFHCESVLAFQTRARALLGRGEDFFLPFVIMTSESNHALVLDVLAHKDSCANQLNITLVKQSEVACFENAAGRLQVKDFSGLATKPHGHGDIHTLLYKTGLARRFMEEGNVAKHLVFFQDTNLLGFHSVLAAVGNSVRLGMDANFVCVERSNAQEPMGLVCQTKTLPPRTVSIEYNLLDPAREYDSAFPGNINLLVFNLPTYCAALETSKGVCPEFVNPKYKSASREFASPARLECLMQDFVLALPLSARVGFTQMERFLAYSPMKNNARDAFLKFQETGFAASPSSCESDFYHTNRELLAMCGVQVRTLGLGKRRFLNIPFEEGARIVILPSFAVSMAELRERFPTPHLVRISERSSLVLEGDVVVHELDLDGHLHLSARVGNGSRLVVAALQVHNAGTELVALQSGDEQQQQSMVAANEKIRGFTVIEREGLRISSESGSEVFVDRPVGNELSGGGRL